MPRGGGVGGPRRYAGAVDFHSSVQIGPHTVDREHRPLVIAEMSGNHNGAARPRAGHRRRGRRAPARTRSRSRPTRADTITIDADTPRVPDRGRPRPVGRAQPLPALQRGAHAVGLARADLRAGPRARAAPLLHARSTRPPSSCWRSWTSPVYKIASAEIVDLPLIRAIAGTGKPMIISTGMATLGEIDAAVERGPRRRLHRDRRCSPARRPTRPRREHAQPAPIPVLPQAFGVPVGLSDHTLGIGVAVAAVALGAVPDREARDPDPGRRRRRLGLLARAGRARRRWSPRRSGPGRRVGTARIGPTPRPSGRGCGSAARSTSSQDVRAGDPVTERERPLDPTRRRPGAGRDEHRPGPHVHPGRRTGHPADLGPDLIRRTRRSATRRVRRAGRDDRRASSASRHRALALACRGWWPLA